MLDLKFLIRQDRVIALPNIILYGHNQLDLRIGHVQYVFYYTEENCFESICHFEKARFLDKYSRVPCIKSHFLSLRSKPVCYRMRKVSRECSSFLFEVPFSILGFN